MNPMRTPPVVALGLLLLLLALGLSHTSATSIMEPEQLSANHVVAQVVAVSRNDPPQPSHLRVPKKDPPPSMQVVLLADWEPCESSSQCSNGCCSSQYSDDPGQLQCTPLIGEFRSNDSCMEKNAATLTSTVTTGTCGNGQIGNGICADGTCCSDLGWCGTSVQHCRSLQQQSGGGSSLSTGTCGNGFRGNGICPDGSCCSQFGYCGTDCSMDNTNSTDNGNNNNNNGTLFDAGEVCYGNSQCMSGFCCHAARTQNGPVFRCSMDPCNNGGHDDHFGNDGNDGNRSGTRDQADFASTPPQKILPIYYIVGVGVILMLLLLIIIYLLMRKRGISCCAKAEPATEKQQPSGMANAPRQSNTNTIIEAPSRELTLPNTITITSNRGKRDPTRQGQLVYPVVDPSISDQSSSYTTPSFPGTTAGRSTLHHHSSSNRHPRSIMSEPTSSIGEGSDH